MRGMRTFSFALALGLFLGLAPQGHAQDTEEPAAPDEEAAATGASPYQAQLATGIRRVSMRDYARATEALRAAIQLDGQRPEAYYYLACTQRQQGDTSAAVTSFHSARSAASTSENLPWEARALQGIAETLEVMATTPATGQAAGSAVNPEALQRAVEGWNAVIRFADTHAQPDLGQLGRTRSMAIHRVIEQDATYAEIRARITAREAELAEERREQEAQRPRGRR
jgi:tetratricopeptide (TPR) repeat protein